MRLLHTTTLQLTDFVGKAPPYAILSHTWGEEEVLFADVSNPAVPKAGWAKVRGSCDLARSLGHNWIWIDTCCIDKSSSAELSEAINSMFRFYQKATICIAYLSDVSYPVSKADVPDILSKSRWFTRGWTLQELLAPTRLDFYSSDWQLLGSRSELQDIVSVVTGIGRGYISGGGGQVLHLGEASVAERMSWASRRRTTRLEDIAYCLLGIFGINMPLIYGEGERAFKRLQQAIIHEIDDQSIFAWGQRHLGAPPAIPTNGWFSPLLAGNPSWFKDAGDIIPFRTEDTSTLISHAGNGVTITTPLLQKELPKWSHRFPYESLNEGDGQPLPFGVAYMPKGIHSRKTFFLAPLKCRPKDDYFNCVAIPLGRGHLQHSTSEYSPSCYRMSHALFIAPRSVWVSRNICKPFVYYQSNYERRETQERSESGCIIRTLPHGYHIAPEYYDFDKLRYEAPPNRIPPNKQNGIDFRGERSKIVLKLQGKSLPDLALTLQFVSDPDEIDFETPAVVGMIVKTMFLSSSFSLEDIAFIDFNKPHPSLPVCDTLITTTTQSAAYGPSIWFVNVIDPQRANTCRETDALAGLFTPLRISDKSYASESVESSGLATSSCSEDFAPMVSRTWNDGHEASRSPSPTSNGHGMYTSQ